MARETYYIVYGRSSCPYCIEAVNLLDFAGIEREFFDLENDRDFIQELKDFHSMQTVPIILKIDGESGRVKLIGGCDDLKGHLND